MSNCSAKKRMQLKSAEFPNRASVSNTKAKDTIPHKWQPPYFFLYKFPFKVSRAFQVRAFLLSHF